MPKRKKNPPEGEAFNELGHLVRQLHETLRELGCDQAMQSVVGELPDTQDRLNYVAQLTEQAAQRSLNAVEIALPLQEKVESEALRLLEEYRTAKANGSWQQVADKMQAFIEVLPNHTRATSEQLNEIMMAQDFQDLTGQVIKKVTLMAQNLEHQLVNILLISKPEETARKEGDSLLNGPVVKKEGRKDVVSSQSEVDDLLNDLGF
ncbi:MAG: protein phosphatase CheZ [Sulfuricella sp.]|nr:protein phosphatase CheZ [Sulfuricella sp.]